MAWLDEQWAVFVNVLQRGFAARDPFTEEDADVYRLLLDGVDPDRAMQAVRELVLEGSALRPRPGEIVARINRDTGIPTFDEAYRLIYGDQGVLRATPHTANGVLTYATEAERRSLYDQAALERAQTMHPLIASFVERRGLRLLRELGVDDPEWGPARRKDLRDAWNLHVEAFAGREVTALATGGDRARSELRRLDPLAALGVGRDAPAEITSGQDGGA